MTEGRAAAFARLKLRLLRNSVRTTAGTVALVLASLTALGVAIFGFLALASGRALDDHDARRLLVSLATTFTMAWVFGPLLTGGIDETVDPGRLALLPLTRRRIITGLTVAALIGPLPIGSAVALVGLPVGFLHANAGALVVLAAGPVLFAFAFAASRAVAITLARAQRSRRGRDVSVVIATLGFAVVWIGTQLIGSVNVDQVDTAVDVLRWLPPGLVAQAVIDASRGDLAPALARLAVTAACIPPLLWWWASGIDRLLVEPPPSHAGRVRAAAGGRTLVGRLPATATGAAIAKELHYLARSPMRRSQLLVQTLMGTALAAVQVLRGFSADDAVLLMPLAVSFVALGSTNLLGPDGASSWFESVLGVPVRTRLVARQVAAATGALVPLALATIVLALIAGSAADVPLMVGVTLAGVIAVMGTASIGSVLVPIPVPDTGNPFSRRAPEGTGCTAGLMGMAVLALTGVVLSPLAIAVVLVHGHALTAQLAVVAGGLLYGLLVWAIGTAVGARLLASREPEVVAVLTSRLVG